MTNPTHTLALRVLCAAILYVVATVVLGLPNPLPRPTSTDRSDQALTDARSLAAALAATDRFVDAPPELARPASAELAVALARRLDATPHPAGPAAVELRSGTSRACVLLEPTPAATRGPCPATASLVVPPFSELPASP